MCTVTYLPTDSGFLITSSRDELNFRHTLPPDKHQIVHQQIVFPKDELAGGTWIASSKTRSVCLLNGAFTKHIRKKKYRKSRGVIMLENFEYKHVEDFVEKIYLDDIEPFTLILKEHNLNQHLYEFRWDGEQKHLANFDANQPKIWASATLYDEQVIKMRVNWFDNWLKEYHQPIEIIDFHRQRKTNDIENDIVVKRNNGLQTVSISQIRFQERNHVFYYNDLISNKVKELVL
jgi:hypothetical protein